MILYELATGKLPFNNVSRDVRTDDLLLGIWRMNNDIDHRASHPLPPHLDEPENRQAGTFLHLNSACCN